MSADLDPDIGEDQLFSHVQVSLDRRTVWVHGADGSTVGRFSKSFGMDVHRTWTAQLEGAGQCLACTHHAPSLGDWLSFVALINEHYGLVVPVDVIEPFA